MNKFVQAIIINDSAILCKTKYNENDQVKNLPISRETLDSETPEEAIVKLIKERLNTSSQILFKLDKEAYSNTTTFLVNIDNIESLSEIIEKNGFRWVSLYDKESFTYNEKLQLGNLLIACIENSYSPEWMEPIRDMITLDNRLGYSNSTITSKIRSKEHRDMDANTHGKDKLLAVITAIILGFAFDKFIFMGTFGVSYTIFTAMIIFIFIYKYRSNIKKVKPLGIFLLGTGFILSLNYAIHSNMILDFLNIIAVPMLITAAFILIRYENIEWASIRFVFSVLNRVFSSTFENIFKPFLFAKSIKKKRERGKLNPQTKSILIGLAVSMPLLIIILPLLSSADSVFGYYISNLGTQFTKISIGNTVWNIIRIVIFSSYLFGFLWSFHYSYSKDTKPGKINGKLEPITVLTVLIIINLVYLLFTIVQFSYLYGGETSLPNGFTYAEYARRGFFELVLVTVINFTILIITTIYTKKENKLSGILNAAYTLLIVFTLNMLYSAHYKMSLYESAFGYTYLRIFVHLFLVLLFILFLIALTGIWVKKLPVARLSIIAALLMYIFVNFVNVDSIIVRKNIERYYKTGKIDVHYLASLSYDVVPQVIEFAKDSNINSSISKSLVDYTENKKKFLNKTTKWYEFNYSRFRAREILNEQ